MALLLTTGRAISAWHLCTLTGPARTCVQCPSKDKQAHQPGSPVRMGCITAKGSRFQCITLGTAAQRSTRVHAGRHASAQRTHMRTRIHTQMHARVNHHAQAYQLHRLAQGRMPKRAGQPACPHACARTRAHSPAASRSRIAAAGGPGRTACGA